mmetsp:Transcript_64698/g.140962  ORF Transcript_64698/g.140962 Transcript_64698/m.140962 type:complete len:452 (+) Transcript_64698:48-1403(+)
MGVVAQGASLDLGVAFEWQFCEASNDDVALHWHSVDERAQASMERLYGDFRTCRTSSPPFVLMGGGSYMIDFIEMRRECVHTGSVQRLRRIRTIRPGGFSKWVSQLLDRLRNETQKREETEKLYKEAEQKRSLASEEVELAAQRQRRTQLSLELAEARASLLELQRNDAEEAVKKERWWRVMAEKDYEEAMKRASDAHIARMASLRSIQYDLSAISPGEEHLPFRAMDQTELVAAAQNLLRRSSHHGVGSRCNPMRDATVTRVYKICQLSVMRNYLRSKEAILEDFRKCAVPKPDLVPPVSKLFREFFPQVALDDDVGEELLLHGTTEPRQIAELGFDERCARASGLYGQGVYFAENSCKCFQYTDGAERCIILSRVALGDPYYTACELQGLKRPPHRRPERLTPSFHKSVVANAGICNGFGLSQHQQHREFVLFDGRQAYPDLAIFFTID